MSRAVLQQALDALVSMMREHLFEQIQQSIALLSKEVLK